MINNTTRGKLFKIKDSTEEVSFLSFIQFCVKIDKVTLQSHYVNFVATTTASPHALILDTM